MLVLQSFSFSTNATTPSDLVVATYRQKNDKSISISIVAILLLTVSSVSVKAVNHSLCIKMKAHGSRIKMSLISIKINCLSIF